MLKSSKLGMNADRAAGLTSVTAISFSLTFVAVSLVLLAGLLPAQLTTLGGSVDTAVVLLFLPLCALAFAIIAEVVRAATHGPLRSAPARRTQPLSEWHSSHEES